MKKLTLFLATFILLTLCVMARPVTPKDALWVAKTYMRQQQPATADKLIWSEAQHPASFTEMYLFTCQPQGFVIVSADDVATPILGFSSQSTFDNKNIPDHVRSWLDGYAQEIRYLTDNNIDQSNQTANEWQQLLNGQDFPRYSAGEVSPLLTTTWSQNPYYNALCPYDSRYGERSVTGCVATAMAQIMKYWNHPIVGNGSHSYTQSDMGTISANFGATTYDWAHMPNYLNSNSSSTQVNAVATLMYHCGVSVEMSYSAAASGAQVYMPSRNYAAVNWALLDYFDYSQDLMGAYKSSYSDSQWKTLLINDLDESLPILYAGFDSESGHAFVCDGYNSSGRFHFNWGWGGYYDGYFAIGALNPGGGGTGSNSSYTFNLENQALLHIHPQNQLRVSPTEVAFTSVGGSTSIQVISGTSTNNWTATSSASWLTLARTSGPGNNTATTFNITAATNNTGTARTATIDFNHANQHATISVVQYACDNEDACSIQIIMSDYYSDGWDGASLTISDLSGIPYGTVEAESGESQTIKTMKVCPSDIKLTWNTGSYDNECSFIINDANGNIKVRQSGAFSSPIVISDPCVLAAGYRITATVNDATMGIVQGTGTFPAGTIDTITAIANPGYRFVGWATDSINPKVITVNGNQNFAATFASLGNDTLRYHTGKIYQTLRPSDETDTLFWAIRLEGVYLGSHNVLKAVMVPGIEEGEHQIRIYKDGSDAPQTLIYSTTETFNDEIRWRTITFPTPIPVSNTEPLWIVIGHKGGSPALTSTYAGTTEGGWYSVNGDTWRTLEPTMGTFMIRGIFGIDETQECSIRTLPYKQDFEESMLCWQKAYIDESTSNNQQFGRGRASSNNSAYSGSYLFKFSSYYHSTNYNQYLISPRIDFGQTVDMKFYYNAPYGGYKSESFRVLYSTGSNNLNDFVNQLRNVTVSNTDWNEFKATLPANAKYVLINYYSNDKYFLYVDDIEFTEHIDDGNEDDECLVTAPWMEKFTNNSPTIGCWKATDYDGDGYNWRITPTGQMGVDDDGFASSASYVNYVGAISPDNYFTSPAVIIPDTGTYSLTWAASGYGYDYNEHYSVYLSYSATAIDTNRILYSTTINRQSYDTHYVSLAEYAGDTVYFVFRHHNCTDQYMLLLDNIGVVYDPTGGQVEPEIDSCTVLLPWTETFNNNSLTIGCWMIDDHDNDGEDWTLAPTYAPGYNDRGIALSYSKRNNNSLTPDNWLFSPAIPIPDTGEYMISWAVRALDPTAYREHYSVYISTDPDIFDDAFFSETLSSYEFVDHYFSINQYRGQTIYIAFRHHDCSGQYAIALDDISVKYGSAPSPIPVEPDECVVSLPWTETFSSTSATIDCWAMYDNDDDGETWGISPTSTYGYNDNGVAASNSYHNSYGPLFPDNILVSPAINIPATGNYTLSWAAAGYDETDFYEHYSVYVATDPTSFQTPIFSETLQTHNYVYHTVDISDYRGQTIYIAFRHHDCTNQYILVIDDVSVRECSAPDPQPGSDCTVQLPWAETFSNNSPTVSCWQGIDNNNDGFNWNITNSDEVGYRDKGAAWSVSYDADNETDITPDNLLISPAIQIPSNGNYILSWAARPYATRDLYEHYTVYISTDPAHFSQALFSETLRVNNYVEHTIDLTPYRGQTVYIAFRHHDCTGQNVLFIDDVIIQAGTLPTAIDDVVSMPDVELFPNPTNSILHIKADGIQTVELYDYRGRLIITTHQAILSLQNLPVGTYTARIITNKGVAVKRVIRD